MKLSKENSILIFLLGLFSTIMFTTTFEKSYIIGLIVLIVLVFSAFITSIIIKIANVKIKLSVYIILISILITIIEIILNKYVKGVYESFGIYLSLITTNYLILRNKDNTIKNSFKKGLVFLISISVIGLFRELFGNGTITMMNDISQFTGYREIIYVFNNNIIPNKIFLNSAGIFIVMGLVIGIINTKVNRGEK